MRPYDSTVRVAENKNFDASGLLANNRQGYRCNYGPILSLLFSNGPGASEAFGAGMIGMTLITTNHTKSTIGVL